MDKDIMIVADYTTEVSFNIDELCEICRIANAEAEEFVRYDILVPHGTTITQWTFDMVQLQRLRKAIRLRRDLELNYAGIALVLQLLAEIEELRATTNIYHKHVEK